MGGLYVIHGPTGTKKPACLNKGLLISVRSGVNARPARRLISRPADADPDRDRAKSAGFAAQDKLVQGLSLGAVK